VSPLRVLRLGDQLEVVGTLCSVTPAQVIRRAEAREVLPSWISMQPACWRAMLSTSPKCVLVVDDDVEIRHVVGDILQFGGYQVELAADGEQALAQISATRPDAILLDLMMPVMDGWTFLQHCRADPHTRARPVVVLSVHANLGDTASELQVQGVLAKPFELADLLSTVEHVLQVSDGKTWAAFRRRAR
jgi:two-component system chemotaxis response regulator CheY